VKDTVDRLWTSAAGDQQAKILTWISEIPFQDDHHAARSNRTEHTGEWLLRHEKFEEWTGSSQSTILWLHGIRM